MDIMELTLANSDVKALIDREDYPKVGWTSWFMGSSGYVVANHHNTQILLHRLVMGHPSGRVDHVDRVRHHCHKQNLRLATHVQNLANSGPKRGRKYKGVYATNNGTFRASICLDWKQIHLGTFKHEIDAIRAYNKAAKAAWGEFAYLNPE